MGCITQGHAVACADKNRRGGIKRIWLVEEDAITYSDFATGGTNGEIDQMTSTSAFEFEFDRETAGFTANATRENGSTIVEVELTFYVPKLTQEVNTRLNELSCSCGVVAIVETFADDGEATPSTYFFVLGWDSIFKKEAFLEFSSGEMQTGVALQDANGTQVTLVGRHAEYPREGLVEVDITNGESPSTGNFGIVKASDWSSSNLKYTVEYTA